MKRFHQLTKPQQEQAINFAANKLHELMTNGFVVSDREMTKEHVREIATCAAEEAWYSERNDQVIADIADGK